MKSDFKEQWMIRVAVVAVIVMVLLRFVPALWRSLALFAGVALIGGIVYLLYEWFRPENKVADNQQDAVYVRISTEIEVCKNKADRYRTEAGEIRQRHRQLAAQLEKSDRLLRDNARDKAKKVLSNLDSELGLRLAKATFFEESQQRLSEMLEAHKLHQELKRSEEKLEEWQAENYIDIDAMEAMKDRVEREKIQLETISDLTHRASASQDLDHTERLRQKLKTLRGQ